jgi:hypothetical protein
MSFLKLVGRCVLLPTLVAGCLSLLAPVDAAAQGEDRPPVVHAGGDVLMSLPPERAARVRDLQKRVKMTNAQLEERLRAQREQLEELYQSFRFDSTQCQRLHQGIRQTQDQLLALHHRFQMELRTLLTEAEFDMLQRQFQKAREEKLKFLRSQGKLKGDPD